MTSLSEEYREHFTKSQAPGLVGHPLLKNFPDNLEDVDWRYCSKEEYIELENIMTDGVKFFEPFLVENFYPEDMFNELVELLTSNKLENIDYSHQMNKWEEGVEIPQKFIDYAVEKVKTLLGHEDILFGYHMYAHHQITSEGRIPKLPLHIDWSPGPYMVDLHIGGNRDWGFVARYKNFITKPNQAIICQPQFDYHYRPSWSSENPSDYYQALFFHLVNKNHWSRTSSEPGVDRAKEVEELNTFGQYFRDTEKFKNFQDQRRHMFEKYYLKSLYQGDAPDIPWDEVPTKEDAQVHQRKGVTSKTETETI
jgi:hypothetical protein